MLILPMAYHVNGSVRGKLAVTEEDLSWLSERYDFYVRHVKEEIQSFVLPQGTEAAAALHLCRSEAKIISYLTQSIRRTSGSCYSFRLPWLIS